MYCPIYFTLLNIQGLASKSNNKLEWPEVKNCLKKMIFILFTETWGNAYTKFDFDNFQHFELNRNEYKPNKKRSSGGLG